MKVHSILRSMAFLFFLPLNVAFAGSETLKENGRYVGKTDRGHDCHVLISEATTKFHWGAWDRWLHTATLSTNLLPEGELVQLRCKNHIEEGFRCVGETSSKTLVILRPHWVHSGEGKITKAHLAVFPNSDTSLAESCNELELDPNVAAPNTQPLTKALSIASVVAQKSALECFTRPASQSLRWFPEVGRLEFYAEANFKTRRPKRLLHIFNDLSYRSTEACESNLGNSSTLITDSRGTEFAELIEGDRGIFLKTLYTSGLGQNTMKCKVFHSPSSGSR